MTLGWTDLVGGIGVAILMITFLMLQLSRLPSRHLSYSLLNALGASLIAFSLLYNFNLAAFVIEVFWILISLIGVVRIVRERARKS